MQKYLEYCVECKILFIKIVSEDSPFVKRLKRSGMSQLRIKKQAIYRDTSSLDKYLQEIRKAEKLTLEEEAILSQKIKSGDDEALRRLVQANLRFVISVAQGYQNQGLTLQDLINEGNLGLIKAAQRFDETQELKFTSYAIWWIRTSILQALAEHSRIVRLPINKLGSLTRINKAFAQLEQTYEREPSSLEVAELLEMFPEEVKETMKINEHTVSIDAPISVEENNTMHDLLYNSDLLSPDSNLMNESLLCEIKRALCALSPREAKIIILYFGLGVKHPRTLAEIGEELKLTHERVRQIKEKALKKIQSATISCRVLKSYLG